MKIDCLWSAACRESWLQFKLIRVPNSIPADINQTPPSKHFSFAFLKFPGKFQAQKSCSFQVFSLLFACFRVHGAPTPFISFCVKGEFFGVFIFLRSAKGSSSAERKTTLWAKLDLLSIALAIVRAWNIKLHKYIHTHHAQPQSIYIVRFSHTLYRWTTKP